MRLDHHPYVVHDAGSQIQLPTQVDCNRQLTVGPNFREAGDRVDDERGTLDALVLP